MKDILEFTFRSFWTFMGMLIIICVIIQLIMFLYNRPMRHRVLMKHGYPPAHCDADGDLMEEEDKEESL